jgi:hypothetical protein
MLRTPVVAGRFYTGNPDELRAEVRKYLDMGRAHGSQPVLLAMAPHAGYMFSGKTAGETLGRVSLPDTVLLLGPNHTGMGEALALWPDEAWSTPLGDVPVDEDLARALLTADPNLTADYEAHLQEHSLEVICPFLQELNPHISIVPIAVAEPRYEVLEAVAANMAEVLKARTPLPGIVVSSDMSHFISHDEAKELDRHALERVEALDPEGLYSTVRSKGISMCGVLPMTLGLLIAQHLGAAKAEVVTYTTSAEASGDYSQVVGYAGVVVR